MAPPGDAGLQLKQIRRRIQRHVMQVAPAIDEIMEIVAPPPWASCPTTSSIGTRPSAKLRAAYEKKYGKGIINAFVPAFYHCTFLVVEAIKRADSTDTTKVRAAERPAATTPASTADRDQGETYGVNRQLMFPTTSQVKGGKIVKLTKFTP
jgi:hypothetical protein